MGLAGNRRGTDVGTPGALNDISRSRTEPWLSCRASWRPAVDEPASRTRSTHAAASTALQRSRGKKEVSSTLLDPEGKTVRAPDGRVHTNPNSDTGGASGDEHRPRATPSGSLVPSDRELLQAHVENDARAFNEIARRHRLDLWIIALRILGDRDDADDAVQEALVRAFRAAATYRGESEVRAWLRAIVENVSRTVARRRDRNGREVVGLPPEEDRLGRHTAAGPDAHLLEVAEAEELLRHLEDPYRRTFVLVKLRGFSYAETAAIEQISVNTVRSRVGRAKAMLIAADAAGKLGRATEPGP